MSLKIKPEELLAKINHKPPSKGWMDTPVEFKKGTYNNAAVPDALKYLHQPNQTFMCFRRDRPQRHCCCRETFKYFRKWLYIIH